MLAGLVRIGENWVENVDHGLPLKPDLLPSDFYVKYIIAWPAAIIYLRKHESPATAPSSEGNAQDGLTQKVSSLLFPYLRAWTDQAEIGDPAFDECATVESLADLLAARVVRLLRTEI